MVVAAILNLCEKTGFACIDFSRLLVYEYRDLENKIEEKLSVAICGGSVVIFAGL